MDVVCAFQLHFPGWNVIYSCMHWCETNVVISFVTENMTQFCICPALDDIAKVDAANNSHSVKARISRIFICCRSVMIDWLSDYYEKRRYSVDTKRCTVCSPSPPRVETTKSITTMERTYNKFRLKWFNNNLLCTPAHGFFATLDAVRNKNKLIKINWIKFGIAIRALGAPMKVISVIIYELRK